MIRKKKVMQNDSEKDPKRGSIDDPEKEAIDGASALESSARHLSVLPAVTESASAKRGARRLPSFKLSQIRLQSLRAP